MNKKDVRKVSSTASAKFNEYGAFIFLLIPVMLGKISSDLSDSGSLTAGILGEFAFVLLVVICMLALGIVAMRRRYAVRNMLQSPRDLARIELMGPVVRIIRRDGKQISFIVKPNWSNPTTMKEVSDALRRIAPHAIATSTIA